ncbi:MAG: hypothetical protein ACREIA_01440 [Opitutaceae bacterium]
MRFPRRAWMIAAAACLAFGGLLSVWLLDVKRTAVAPVARVTYQEGASRTESVAMKAELHELTEGMMRFETGAGAVVTVAAPAVFNLVSAERIELTKGRMTARMLREESRLVVSVGGFEVRDLGTAFGLDARENSRSLLSVFEGEVAVSDGAGPGAGSKLSEGQSAVGGRGANLGDFERTAFTPESFADLWPLTMGINEASRLVEFLPPGPLLRPLREYRANDRLFLLPERQGVSLSEALMVDLSPEVSAWPESPVSPYPLPAGKRVSSHLVFFQPEPSAPAGLRRLSGEIVFEEPVVGVLCSDSGLLASDGLLGVSGADYRTPGQRRGMEEADKMHCRASNLPHDSIRIGRDGHTLIFDLYVSDEREQMRVLVAADKSPPAFGAAVFLPPKAVSDRQTGGRKTDAPRFVHFNTR